MMFVRVGDKLWWLLMKDEFVVKLDFSYYYFIICFLCKVDEMDMEMVCSVSLEVLSYGVIFLLDG